MGRNDAMKSPSGLKNGVIYYRDGQVTAKLRNQEAELIPPAGPDPTIRPATSSPLAWEMNP